MQKKRIFITGGTGFFGKSLFRHCLELREHDIVLLSPEYEKDSIALFPLLKDMQVKILFGDVRDFEFPECNFDYIIHAATTSCKTVSDTEMRSVVVDGTRHVLNFASGNKNLSNLLYVSSGAVYGNRFNVPVREDYLCKPVTVYGKSKRKAEKICLDSGIPCSIARGFAFVGEYLPINVHFAIGNFIRDCLRNQSIIIKGDGTPVRSYLYAGDLAHWLWTILLHGEPGRAYNVGSDYAISISKLAETVKKIAGTNNEIEIRTPPSETPPQLYVPDIFRVQRELGLHVETSLEKAIRRSLEYHGHSPKWQVENNEMLFQKTELFSCSQEEKI